MYIAHGTVLDEFHKGSTRLHMDLTDAINVMLWAADLSDGNPGYAEWTMFGPTAAPLINKFLEENYFDGPSDPIHSQQIYLTPSMLSRLENEYHVKPFIIKQYPGDAVVIPAGCPHQVRSLSQARATKHIIESDHLATGRQLCGCNEDCNRFRFRRKSCTNCACHGWLPNPSVGHEIGR